MAKKNKKTPKSAFVPGYVDAEPSADLLLDFLAKQGRGKSFALAELLAVFRTGDGMGSGAGRGRKREFEALLAELVAEGRLIRLKGPAYTLPEGLRSLSGHIRIQRQGMGFVRPREGHATDEIYVHPSQLNGAWDGDLVRVGILPGRSGKSREGRVLEVLERRVRELLVELLPQTVKEDGLIKRLARPLDTRLPGYLLVDSGGLAERPRQGDLVLVEPVPGGPKADGVIRARALSAFGAGESLAMYERLVKAEHNIATEFPAQALEELQGLPADPDPDAALLADGGPARRDLRGLEFVTIDGADARDFDDAVCVKREAGGYTLWVGIADVAHYVRPGSQLDREALRRGNSCYFPASVEPMLPPALSNGLCSLRPRVPRLALAAELKLDSRGVLKKSKFYRALIQSRARLTYEELEAALAGPEQTGPEQAGPEQTGPEQAGPERAGPERAGPEQATPALRDLLPMLREASALARALITRREARGTLSFDLPEARAEVDGRGRVTALGLRARLFSHRLIEEFMIAANEAVAAHLAAYRDGHAAGDLSFLYRAHPAPDADKLAELAKVLAQGGLAQSGADAALPERPGAGDLQRLLDAVRGTPREFVVNRLVLRSLMQAVYSPVPEGHFGLASEAYTHFTSPIRRYADLTVHRALLRSLGYGGKTPSHGVLAQIAADLNEREREAVEAERDIFKICAALYLKDYIGGEFAGVVSGLSAFGLFVELTEPPCEGFVRLESLPDDYYRLDHERQALLGQRGGARYGLGRPLALRLVRADPLRREITFELAETGQKNGKRAKGQNKPGSKNKAENKPPPRARKKRPALPKGSVRRRS